MRKASVEKMRMVMVRHCDNKRIEIVCFFVEHLPVVTILSGVRIFLKHSSFRYKFMIEIAQGNDLFLRTTGKVVPAHSRNTHAGNRECIAGRLIFGASKNVTWDDQRRSKSGS